MRIRGVQQYGEWILWGGILLLAGWLRFYHLAAEPVHADEAVNAWRVGEWLAGEAPRFDPTHYHGLSLIHLGALAATVGGADSFATMSIVPLRAVAAWTGLLVVLLPLGFRRELGAAGALFAGALTAVSPGMVWFSRMFIHETLFVACAVAGGVALWRWCRRPAWVWAVAAGLIAGTLQATKGSSVIVYGGWAVAALVLFPGKVSGLLDTLRERRGQVWALLAAGFGVWGLLQTGFGAHPGALWDGVRTYWLHELAAGHEKGWGYYAGLLTGGSGRRSLLAGENVIVALAVGACVYPGALRVPFVRAVAAFVATTFLVLSAISYKTPWLVLTPLAGLILLAAWVLGRAVGSDRKVVRILAMLAGLSGLLVLAGHTGAAFAQGRSSANPRNYAYVATSPDLLEAVEVIERVRAIRPDPPVDAGNLPAIRLRASPGLEIAVISENPWPLPWYLRSLSGVGWWPASEGAAPAAEMLAGLPVVVLDSAADERLGPSLAATHTATIRGIRAGEFIHLYVRHDLFEHLVEENLR